MGMLRDKMSSHVRMMPLGYRGDAVRQLHLSLATLEAALSPSRVIVTGVQGIRLMRMVALMSTNISQYRGAIVEPSLSDVQVAQRKDDLRGGMRRQAAHDTLGDRVDAVRRLHLSLATLEATLSASRVVITGVPGIRLMRMVALMSTNTSQYRCAIGAPVLGEVPAVQRGGHALQRGTRRRASRGSRGSGITADRWRLLIPIGTVAATSIITYTVCQRPDLSGVQLAARISERSSVLSAESRHAAARDRADKRSGVSDYPWSPQGSAGLAEFRGQYGFSMAWPPVHRAVPRATPAAATVAGSRVMPLPGSSHIDKRVRGRRPSGRAAVAAISPLPLRLMRKLRAVDAENRIRKTVDMEVQESLSGTKATQESVGSADAGQLSRVMDHMSQRRLTDSLKDFEP